MEERLAVATIAADIGIWDVDVPSDLPNRFSLRIALDGITGERRRARHALNSFFGVRSLLVKVFCKTRYVYRELTSALIVNQIAAS